MYVYIISNEAFDGWLKVGKTKDIKKRVSNLNTGSPYEYRVELLIEMHDDKPIHNRLVTMGYESSREWFKVELAELRGIVLRVKSDWERWDPERDSPSSDSAAANDSDQGDQGWHIPARSPKLVVSQ